MRTNIVNRPKAFTHEGAPANHHDALESLKRSVMACLLWEDTFYEDGLSVADRIAQAAEKVPLAEVVDLAVYARRKGNLRHAPLWLMAAALNHKDRLNHRQEILIGIDEVCQRPDDLGELLSMYWKPTKRPLAAVLKEGLGNALGKFDAYRLSKYAARGGIRLRDVLFMTHPKPKDDAHAAIWKQLADDTLTPADTWEVALSSGKDKAETFRRLLAEKQLGGLATLRNLRNMQDAGLSKMEVAGALIQQAGKSGILPFQYIAAARAVPQWEDIIELAMLAAMAELPKLTGRTVLLVDVSGSMFGAKVSKKSQLDRADAAAALAILIREVCEEVAIVPFASQPCQVPPRRGFALRDAIVNCPVANGGTDTRLAVEQANRAHPKPDRILIITDEQSHTTIPAPVGKGYVMNVGTYEQGIGYGSWIHISGFSENMVRYVVEAEGLAKESPKA